MLVAKATNKVAELLRLSNNSTPTETRARTRSALGDCSRRAALISAALIVGLAGCKKGGGNDPGTVTPGEPPFDPSFLDLDPPGTLVASGSAVQANHVHVLDAAEGISEDPATGTVTLATPLRTYQVDDIILGDGTFTFAYRVTGIRMNGQEATLSVAQASLPEVFPDGGFSFRATPDWAAANNEDDTEITVLPDGTIQVSDYPVLDLSIDSNGAVDWPGTSFLGESLTPGFPGLGEVATSAVANGHVTVKITQGSIRATPSWQFDPSFGGGSATSVHGTLNVHTICDFEMEVTVSGHQGGNARFHWDCWGTMKRFSRPFVFFVGSVPVYGRVGLDLPVNLYLDAKVGGTFAISHHSEAAIRVAMDYTPATGFEVEKTLSRTMTGSSSTQGNLQGSYRVTVSGVTLFRSVVATLFRRNNVTMATRRSLCAGV
ncbi:MAG: hypothetical protein KDC98_02685 [Planctomycetes bacterium]|nr:hypothetical protein [Planctomycetota bacterium]